MSSDIRWVGFSSLDNQGKTRYFTKDGSPYIGLPPTLNDLLETANEVLMSNPEDFEFYSHGRRTANLTKLAEFIDYLKVKGILK
ncbi:hypothetical protein Barba19A_gp036 [Rheinheimera phage vB_RspM_Barba19A]|uniref:Uncharacterized protein n=2 Tax=Barbavirus barba19A TaxID=2734091 RepID=A0A4P8NHD8_9CAUD|nr:hypothetical protein HOV47_gp036 [Rheinheimera phage vB_RspM_Barba19A]QCQ61876.1 hypothetical protein Barba19A_gp036 [Rheinheimera phage vB_RspM_Barba19A]QCQ64626.1 hypothetical protein Barba31A_gp036 [Rheinheimera phage vB_RspM_Barba31A]